MVDWLSWLPLLAGFTPETPTGTRIYGGEAVEDDEYRTTVAVLVEAGTPDNYSMCTGTVITPRLVLTAAHCLDSAAGPDDILIRFGASIFAPAAETWVDSFGIHPDFCPECDDDIFDVGYLVLGQDVLEEPSAFPVPITTQDEYDTLIFDGAPAILVGYGEDDDGETGFKRAAEVKITSFSGSGHEIHAGGNGKDTCLGDSGGPLFVRREDGALRLAGITSRGAPECGSGGIYSVPMPALCWIQTETDIPLLPDECGDCKCVDLDMTPPEKGCRNAVGLLEPVHAKWGLLLLAGAILRRRSPQSARRR